MKISHRNFVARELISVGYSSRRGLHPLNLGYDPTMTGSANSQRRYASSPGNRNRYAELAVSFLLVALTITKLV